MGISTKLAQRFNELNSEARKRLVRMAWSDKVSTKEIFNEFELTINQVEKFMLSELGEKDYIRWRKRRVKRFNQKSRQASIYKEPY